MSPSEGKKLWKKLENEISRNFPRIVLWVKACIYLCNLFLCNGIVFVASYDCWESWTITQQETGMVEVLPLHLFVYLYFRRISQKELFRRNKNLPVNSFLWGFDSRAVTFSPSATVLYVVINWEAKWFISDFKKTLSNQKQGIGVICDHGLPEP